MFCPGRQKNRPLPELFVSFGENEMFERTKRTWVFSPLTCDIVSEIVVPLCEKRKSFTIIDLVLVMMYVCICFLLRLTSGLYITYIHSSQDSSISFGKFRLS